MAARCSIRGIALLMMMGAASFAHAEERVDFARDVVPALTRAGCNSGACHGSFRGRGGFMLSLLGFDPDADYEEIVKAARGRRVMPSSPANSWLLLKATGAVAHGGGRKLNPAMPAYGILRNYISQGAMPADAKLPQLVGIEVSPKEATLKPGETLTIRATARFADGSHRDVAEWALFDARDASLHDVSPTGVVTAMRAGKSAISVRYLGQVATVTVSTPFGGTPIAKFAPANYIDEHAAAEWSRLMVAPAGTSSDSEFVRRVFLDLIGTLPTPEETGRFLKDQNPKKRSALIDDLLGRPEYVDHWTLKWGDLLRSHRRNLGEKGVASLNGWIRQCMRENRPLDRMTRELLGSQGNLFTNGPVAFFFNDKTPEETAEATAQLFLGVRLQCAKCHHHPFEVWGQDDYYGLAAFFTRLEIRENGDKGRFGGMQSLRVSAAETRKLQRAASPGLLGKKVATAGDDDPRPALADWIVHRENPYFARNFVNRYWAYLTGRGLVEPIDDFRGTNPASHPPLLDALAKDFADHGYDVKHLIRTICNSRVYQLASEVAAERDRDGSLLTHRVPRRMPAEVLLDAVNQTVGIDETFAGTLPGTRALALPDSAVPSPFLTTFGRPLRNNTCECSRESTPDLLQALHLLNNSALHAKLANPKGRIARMLASKKSERDIAEDLYLAAYSRFPTAAELQSMRSLLAEAATPQEGWEDVVWAVLNSAEFSFNH